MLRSLSFLLKREKKATGGKKNLGKEKRVAIEKDLKNMYAIEVQELTKRYRVKKKLPLAKALRKGFRREKVEYVAALRNINLNATAGEALGILGVEGAGKTTLIKTLACKLKPDYGLALVNGYDLVKDSRKVKNSVSVMPSIDEMFFNSRLTVYQNLMFVALKNKFSLKLGKERVNEVLRLTQIEAIKDYYPRLLKSSQLQRLNFAKCLLVDSTLYLLDEPFATIDSSTVNIIKDIIKKLKSEGKTVVLTASKLSDVWLCDKVAILNAGSIIRVEETQKLKKFGKDIFILDFKELSQELVRNLAELEFVDKIIFEKARVTLYGDLRKENFVQVLDLCKNHCILSIDFKEVDLRDILFELIIEEERALEIK